ncbi:AI-2E family transporter [Algoriphagus litoralis]|uniref:AI-2E family transporter n=1 Tax=Algoriphagus litoralis TaxID=2202829 RepID=UPI000DBAC352|nr:AI-2E family transporter [Algoriphagus litoralis]
MNTKNKSILTIFALVLFLLFSGIKGMVLGASFFIPLSFAIVLALLLIPLARKLENKGFSSGLASISCVVLAMLAYLTFFFLLAAQGQNLSEQWPEIKNEIKPKIETTLSKLEEKTGYDLERHLPGFLQEDSGEKAKEDQANQNNPSSSNFDIAGKVAPVAMNVFGFFGNSLLTFVYLFFLISFRHKVRTAVLLFFEESKRDEVEQIFNKSMGLVLSFLGGKFLLITFLAIIYSIGLSIAGVENAIIISLMAALFSLIPYLGVMTGFVLSITFTLVGGGDLNSLIIVAVTYSIAQFVESYLLEPYVVGDKVNLNPLMTVLVVVAGGMIWGVAGMVLSIPFTAIIKVICDAVKPLEPIGYLLGGEDNNKDDMPGPIKKWTEKLVNQVKKRF